MTLSGWVEVEQSITGKSSIVMIGELAFVVSSASQLTKVIDMARNNIDNFAFISFRIKSFCNKRKYGYFIALLELCNHQISIAYISKQHIYILILGTIIYVRLLSMLSFNILAVILYNPTKIAQSNRHLTTTQSCLQYPNQEWLLQYPMLETHGSWLVM